MADVQIAIAHKRRQLLKNALKVGTAKLCAMACDDRIKGTERCLPKWAIQFAEEGGKLKDHRLQYRA